MINVHDLISNSSMFKKFQVDDLLFCEYKCPIEQKELSLWSHTNGFVYVVSGKKKYKTIRGEYMAEEGQALLIKKGANIVEQYFEKVYCMLVIFVPDDFIKSVIEKYRIEFSQNANRFNSDKIIYLNLDEILSTYFLSIFSYFPKPDPPPQNLLKLKFEELIINLLSNKNNPEAAEYFKEIFTSNKVSIKEIMEENFAFNMRIDEYARLCCRSLSAFKREFQNIFGLSPGKWLTRKRLEYAKYLIENSGKTIDEIIFYSGFKNQSHFIKVFKEKFGTTPSRLKRKSEAA